MSQATNELSADQRDMLLMFRHLGLIEAQDVDVSRHGEYLLKLRLGGDDPRSLLVTIYPAGRVFWEVAR